MSQLVAAGLMLILPVTLWANKPHYDINDQVWTNKYDSLFQRYTDRLFDGDVSWEIFKIQAIAESGLRRKVRHKSGAKGLMQIMPVTFKEIRKHSPELKGKSLYSAKWNIAAGITYSRYLYQRWGEQFQGDDRIALMLASYNAGYSRTLKAVIRAKKTLGHNDVKWKDISRFIPRGTRVYVQRILSSLPDESLHESHVQVPFVKKSLSKHKLEEAAYVSTESISSIVDWMHALPVDDSSVAFILD